MAKKHITQTIDDLDGSVVEDAETVLFSIDGRAYEIDLSEDNARKLRDAFSPFMSAGRPLKSSDRSLTRKTRTTPTHDLTAVRAWAEENGHTVSSRGRVPQQVLDAYDAAN